MKLTYYVHIHIHHPGLNILFLNIRDIENHFSKLECLNTALNNKNHIIITAETWLGKYTNQSTISFNNYQNAI